MDRRDFFKFSAGAVVSASLLGRSTEAFARSGRKYNVVILGDTHYDAADPEKYHAGYTDPNPKREANHRKEFVRNGNMWAGRCPDLVKRAACLVDDDTRFVLQMGDLIQGDTATAEIHRQFLDDAMNLFKQDLAPDLPFVTVAGNHDLRGNDDAVVTQAYHDYMPARMSRELGLDITDTNFLFNMGDDAYVVLDFSHPDVEKIDRLFAEADGARHTFVIVHSPVFPYDSASYWWWFLLGNREDTRAEERRYVRRLLASRESIVLCGHTHKTELLDWYGDGGRITQMTMSSVWAKESQGAWTEKVSAPEGYGSLLVASKPELGQPGPVQDIFNEYRPGIRRYSWADAAGSYKLSVGSRDIHVDFYAGSASRRSKRFRLR
ncbi:MAG: metallophosphoesterase [Bacteroidales bacterium]|nr:metallophosphoesterase [Bacteroidales bacterium]